MALSLQNPIPYYLTFVYIIPLSKKLLIVLYALFTPNKGKILPKNYDDSKLR